MYYTFHLLLHSRYKFLITLFAYFLIIYVYNNIFIDNYDIIECMKRAKPELTDAAKIKQLTTENTLLKEHLDILTTEYQNELIKNQQHINQVEANQLDLLNQIRELKKQLAEANQTIAKIAGNNVDLRVENSVLKQSNVALRSELENAQQITDKFFTDLFKK